MQVQFGGDHQLAQQFVGVCSDLTEIARKCPEIADVLGSLDGCILTAEMTNMLQQDNKPAADNGSNVAANITSKQMTMQQSNDELKEPDAEQQQGIASANTQTKQPTQQKAPRTEAQAAGSNQPTSSLNCKVIDQDGCSSIIPTAAPVDADSTTCEDIAVACQSASQVDCVTPLETPYAHYHLVTAAGVPVERQDKHPFCMSRVYYESHERPAEEVWVEMKDGSCRWVRWILH